MKIKNTAFWGKNLKKKLQKILSILEVLIFDEILKGTKMLNYASNLILNTVNIAVRIENLCHKMWQNNRQTKNDFSTQCSNSHTNSIINYALSC